ncbi:MAG: 2-amino-4-hydroxy-6-hydroxymethyldihydropteridine diphosphokinase [Bacteroidota bacterium]
MELNSAFLSLGSNLGDRFLALQSAVNELQAYGTIASCSRIYESAPWGFESDQNFYNLCVHFKTSLSPLELLKTCKEIERKIGRTKNGKERYESRLIDIDIVLFGEQIYYSQTLVIPHPLYHQRNFVLIPLNEIATVLRDPLCGVVINQLIQNLPITENIKPINQKIFINN